VNVVKVRVNRLVAESSACLVLFETGANVREENMPVENDVNCLACSQKPSRKREEEFNDEEGGVYVKEVSFCVFSSGT
jgi:hypothetical protein